MKNKGEKMNNFYLINKTNKSIGLISRVSTEGNELELVNRYVSFLKNKNKKNIDKCLAVFIEPKLDSGYPDIVIIEFRKKNMSKLYERSTYLDIRDLKILFECMRLKEVTIKGISDLLGFEPNEVKQSIIKFRKLNFIKSEISNKIIIDYKILNNAIKKIISIEAKIDKWNEALEQANRNFWFATESYILLNKEKCNNNILEECSRNGVGIILVNGSINTILESKSKVYPVSYGSLQFWEWIIKLGGKNDDDV